MNNGNIDLSAFGSFENIGEALAAVAKANEAAAVKPAPAPAKPVATPAARKCAGKVGGKPCSTVFLPRHVSHTFCVRCHKQLLAEQEVAEAEARKRLEPVAAREAEKRLRLEWARSAYEAGALSAASGVKVIESGAQVTVVCAGHSVTFTSPSRAAEIAAAKKRRK